MCGPSKKRAELVLFSFAVRVVSLARICEGTETLGVNFSFYVQTPTENFRCIKFYT